MTLQEAIKIIQAIEPPKLYYFLNNEKEALKLGIEALKDKNIARTHGHAYSHRLLPGETQE